MSDETTTEEKKPRKIAIVGTSRTTMHLAPFDDPSWEIWTLGIGYKKCPRTDRHFELHCMDTGEARWSDEYVAWLKSTDIPCVVQRLTPRCPAGREYPLDQVCETFGNYWTCSIALMIGAAMLEQPEEIGLWGADLAQDSEYAEQRPSVEYAVGLARGLGILVTIPTTSDICQSAGIYAYQTSGGGMLTPFERMMEERTKELTQRLQVLEHELGAKNQEKFVVAGALENLRWSSQQFPKANKALINGNGHG